MEPAHRRPRPGGDEDDLWRDVQAWEAGSMAPSVRPENIVTSPNAVKRPHSPPPASPPPTEVTPASVLQDQVTERSMPEGYTLARPPISALAFPAVFKAEFEPCPQRADPATGPLPTRSVKAPSLFARQLQGLKGRKNSGGASAQVAGPFGGRSCILQGTGLPRLAEVEAIHEENLAKLRGMRAAEIEEAREELLSSMTPEAVAFLRRVRQSHHPPAVPAGEPDRTPPPVPPPPTRPLASHHLPSMPAGAMPELSQELLERFNLGPLEREKLAWIAEAPEPSPGVQTPSSGYAARFDFEGQLVPPDCDVPVQAGLHHHGLEAERAGYTVEELLILARSTLAQQKVVALDALSQVVKRFKQGAWDEVLDQNLVEQVLKSDIVFILRLGLDESTASVREAVMLLFRQLLDNAQDELMLDFHYITTFGHVHPSLGSQVWTDGSQRAELKESLPELKDHELLQVDVILGLLRMDVLHRFAYLLTHLEPTPSITKNILASLIRIARHSLSTASQVAHHEKLMPRVWSLLQSHSTDPEIQQLAGKLIRVLMARNRSLVLHLTHWTGLKEFITRNLAQTSNNVKLTAEVYRIWDTCLRYGVMTELFAELFPIFMDFMLVIRNALDPMAHPTGIPNPTLVGVFMKTMSTCMACPAIPWEMLTEPLSILDSTCRHMSDLFKQNPSLKAINETAVFGACALAICAGILRQSSEDIVKLVSSFSQLFIFSSHMMDWLESDVMKASLGRLASSSVLLSSAQDGRQRDTPNLVSLSAIAWKGDLIATLRDDSPFPMLHGWVRVLVAISRTDGTDRLKLAIIKWLENQALRSYLARVATCLHQSSHANWFVDEEIGFLSHCVLLRNELCPPSLGENWQLAHTLMSKCQMKHSEILQTLAQRIVFKVDETLLERALVGMSIDDAQKSDALKVLANLPDIRELYLRLLPKSHGRYPILVDESKLIKTLSLSNGGEIVLPSDWVYMPLIQLCSPELAREDIPAQIGLRQMELSLQWVYVSLLMRPLTSVSENSLHFTRLATTFLSSETFFLEEPVRYWLKLCLDNILAQSQGRLDFALEPIPGIESIKEFYQELCLQYSAVSYGDHLFSLFILLLTTGASNEKLRQVLWEEHVEILKLVKLQDSDIPSGFTVHSFHPEVGQMNFATFKALVAPVLNGIIQEKRNPLLFNIVKACSLEGQKRTDSEWQTDWKTLAPQLMSWNLLK